MKKKLTVIGLVFFVVLFLLIRPYYLFLTQKVKISPFKTIFSFDSLKIYDNQVSILILGIAGESHDGPNLSDLIIVVNYNLETNQLTTMAVPRDIWSDTLKDKINSAYAYGAEKNGLPLRPLDGLKLAKAEITAIFGKPIQYATVIDFEKFKNLIDFFGGIDVKVTNTFDDYAFPIPEEKIKDPSCGHTDTQIKEFTNSNPTEKQIWDYFPCRYEHIHFDAGIVHMDGATALKFVRSRHAEGNEGSDFARGQRQQQVIVTLKNRILQEVKSLNLKKIQALYEELDLLVVRDITNQQLSILGKNIVFKSNLKQKEIVLDESFFTVPNYDLYEGKYVLIPETGNFNQIHQYIECSLKSLSNCDSLKNKGENN